MKRALLCALLFVVSAKMFVPAAALAAEDVPSPAPTLLLTSLQFWALVIGSFTPLVGYILNSRMPWMSENVKGFVQVGLAALGAAVYQQIQAGDLDVDTETLQVIGFAVAGAIGAHAGFWSRVPFTATVLGRGQNFNRGARGQSRTT